MYRRVGDTRKEKAFTLGGEKSLSGAKPKDGALCAG